MKKHLRLMKLSAAGLAAAMVVTGAVPNVPVINRLNTAVEVQAADEVSENISLVADVSSNLTTISGTHYSVSCGYLCANDSGMQVNNAGALTINARKGETITKVVLTYNWGNNKSSLSASPGTFDGNATISDINAQQVTISSSHTAGVKISAVTVYFEGSLSNPTVTLTGGANAKSSGGLLTQSYLPGAMDTVTYTALTGAAFPEFETYTQNGVTVERTSDTVVTVSGTPTANTEITIPDAVSSSKIVTWDSSLLNDYDFSYQIRRNNSYSDTANGITLTKSGSGYASFDYGDWMLSGDATLNFTTATGKFTSIEIETSRIYDGGNWTKAGNTLKWNGTPSNSVSLSGSRLYLEGISSVNFVIEMPADLSTATVTLGADHTVSSVTVGGNEITDLSEFDITYGTDEEHTATEPPTAAGTYYAYVTAKSTSENYTGTAKSAAFVIADKTALETAISDAETYYDSIKEDYADIAATLKTAIETAQAVDDDSEATQEETDNAKTALDTAVQNAKDDVQLAKDKATFEEYKDTQKPVADTLAEDKDTSACKQLIEDAKAAIDALTYDKEKSLDENKAAVDAILEQLETDLAAQRETDKRTVNDVIAKINAIGTVAYTEASKEKIDTARNAYDALDDVLKEEVTNYIALPYAEQLYETLKAKSETEDELADALAAKEAAETAKAEAEEKAAAAETAKTEAEEAKAAAEAAKQAAEEAKAAAEAAQQAAEDDADAQRAAAEAARTAQQAAEAEADAQKAAAEAATAAAQAAQAEADAQKAAAEAATAAQTAAEARVAELEQDAETNAEELAAARAEAATQKTAAETALAAKEAAESEAAAQKKAAEDAFAAKAAAETEAANQKAIADQAIKDKEDAITAKEAAEAAKEAAEAKAAEAVAAKNEAVAAKEEAEAAKQAAEAAKAEAETAKAAAEEAQKAAEDDANAQKAAADAAKAAAAAANEAADKAKAEAAAADKAAEAANKAAEAAQAEADAQKAAAEKAQAAANEAEAKIADLEKDAQANAQELAAAREEAAAQKAAADAATAAQQAAENEANAQKAAAEAAQAAKAEAEDKAAKAEAAKAEAEEKAAKAAEAQKAAEEAAQKAEEELKAQAAALFDGYKESAKTAANAMAKFGKGDKIDDLVADAISAIDSTSYDQSKSFAENKAVLDDIVNQLAKDIAEETEKAQPVSVKANAVENNGIMFTAGIDSLRYKEVGFIFEVDGKQVRRSTNTVYSSVEGSQFAAGDFEGAKYVYSFTIDDIAEAGTEIKVTPYSIDLNGIEETGKTEIYSLAQLGTSNEVTPMSVESVEEIALEGAEAQANDDTDTEETSEVTEEIQETEEQADEPDKEEAEVPETETVEVEEVLD